jgi:hypothetical protein
MGQFIFVTSSYQKIDPKYRFQKKGRHENKEKGLFYFSFANRNSVVRH